MRAKAADASKLTDPLADTLLTIGRDCTGDAHRDVSGFFALTQMFPPALTGNPAFRTALGAGLWPAGGRVTAAVRGI